MKVKRKSNKSSLNTQISKNSLPNNKVENKNGTENEEELNSGFASYLQSTEGECNIYAWITSFERFI